MENLKNKLKELDFKLGSIIEAKSNSRISTIINTLYNYDDISPFFRKNIISLNLSLENYFDLENYKKHSFITIKQTMIEVSGLSIDEIEKVINK
jgi:hypothetical protein